MPNCIDVSLLQPATPGYTPLAWQSELGQISAIENVQVHVCTGDFSVRDAEKELHRRTAVKIWSGHGTPNGLLMANGTIRRAQWLATHAKVGLPRLVVLAACYSTARDNTLRTLAEEVSRAGMNVIGYHAEALDTDVVAFNVALVSALAAGAAVPSAFDVALEEISGTNTAAQVFYIPAAMNGYADVVLRLEALEAGQKRTDGQLDAIMSHMGIPYAKHPKGC